MAFENTIKNHTKGNMYRAHQKQKGKITIRLFKLSTLSEHENGKRIVAVFLWTNHFLSSPLPMLRYHVNTTFDTATAALDDDVGCCFRHFFVWFPFCVYGNAFVFAFGCRWRISFIRFIIYEHADVASFYLHASTYIMCRKHLTNKSSHCQHVYMFIKKRGYMPSK